MARWPRDYEYDFNQKENDWIPYWPWPCFRHQWEKFTHFLWRYLFNFIIGNWKGLNSCFLFSYQGQGYSLFKQVGQGFFFTEAPDKVLLAFELLYTQLDLERNGEIWYKAGGFAKPFPYMIPTYCMLHHVKCFVRYLLQIQSQSDCLMLSRKVL